MRGILVALVAAGFAGCQSLPSDAPRATATLQPTKGNKTAGTVDFYQVGDKVRVVGTVNGLVPGREHGFHVHEAGDCSSGDGMSAKGHFNPHGKPHGHPQSAERHAGDLPLAARRRERQREGRRRARHHHRHVRAPPASSGAA